MDHEDEETDNVKAYNAKGERIHISDALSGKRGYYCLSCRREMQAVKARIHNRKSYFRHDVEAVDTGRPCAVLDVSQRIKIAKEILLRLRRIRLPNLYKRPVNANDPYFLISEAGFTEAETALPNILFYEADDGGVACAEKKDCDRPALFVSDVTFFDKENNPVLNVILTPMKKFDMALTLNLKQCGVDTVYVRVPKDSDEEIERAFMVSENTQWIYSTLEDSIDYDLLFPTGSYEAVQRPDGDEGLIPEETYLCRRSEINNLIRVITKCLGSEPYQRAEREILALVGSTEIRIREEEDRVSQEVQGEYRSEELRIEGSIEGVRSKRASLERHYHREFERIKHSIKEIKQEEGRIAEEEGEIGALEKLYQAEFDGNHGPLRGKVEGVESAIRIENAGINAAKERRGALPVEYSILEGEERDRSDRAQDGIRDLIRKAEADERGIEEGRIEVARGEQRKFEADRERTISMLGRRDFTGRTPFAARCRRLVEARSAGLDYKLALERISRVRKAIKHFEEKSYKSWYRGS